MKFFIQIKIIKNNKGFDLLQLILKKDYKYFNKNNNFIIIISLNNKEMLLKIITLLYLNKIIVLSNRQINLFNNHIWMKMLKISITITTTNNNNKKIMKKKMMTMFKLVGQRISMFKNRNRLNKIEMTFYKILGILKRSQIYL